MRNKIQNIEDLKGAKITVMGLGEHGGGIGNIRWLLQQGARLVVTDLKKESELEKSVKKITDGNEEIELVLGEHREKDFTKTDLVIKNPAVPRTSRYLELARSSGVQIATDSSLFFQWFDRSKIIGVTGTKGKSTTTAAIATILDLTMTGIEGTAPLPALGKLKKNDEVVFELSSWRLEPLADLQLSPGTAVVTSIFRDHLNTYNSWEEYVETKKIIIQYQKPEDWALVNMDDPILRTWEKDIAGMVISYSLGDYGREGIFIMDKAIVIRQRGKETDILSVNDLPVEHDHERRNLLPAIWLGWHRGMASAEIKQAMSKFHPLPHRLESLGAVNGVEYINDSAATMPDATIAALSALRNKSIVHILGGNDKELDFKEWAEAEAGAQVKRLIWLPGNASAKMEAAYRDAGGNQVCIPAADMTRAVALAARVAVAGEVVLLSPGATSFGSFKNEFDRGSRFKKAVRDLSRQENK